MAHILDDSGSRVAFGPNQWAVGAWQIPLTTRYVHTGNVSAGTVKALATFTMSDQ